MSTAVNTNIKNFRTFKGITQDDLAKRIGKSKNVISNWDDHADDESALLAAQQMGILQTTCK